MGCRCGPMEACRWMSGGIAVGGLGCDVREVMASVYGCTDCSGGAGPVHIEGRRAIGFNCWWFLPVRSAGGRCGRRTKVDRTHRHSLWGGHVMDVELL
jgi:hypothetical protein